MHPG
ncbi:hypothetical protein Pint_33375 [Pistacia integerrima]